MQSNENLQDITLNCVQCSCEFTFSADEQQFYSEKGFTEPKRCLNCRAANRKNKNRRSNYSNSY